jgi:hypothetical protein
VIRASRATMRPLGAPASGLDQLAVPAISGPSISNAQPSRRLPHAQLEVGEARSHRIELMGVEVGAGERKPGILLDGLRDPQTRQHGDPVVDAEHGHLAANPESWSLRARGIRALDCASERQQRAVDGCAAATLLAMRGKLHDAAVRGEDEVRAGWARLVAALDPQRNLFRRRLPNGAGRSMAVPLRLLSNTQPSVPPARTSTLSTSRDCRTRDRAPDSGTRGAARRARK